MRSWLPLLAAGLFLGTGVLLAGDGPAKPATKTTKKKKTSKPAKPALPPTSRPVPKKKTAKPDEEGQGSCVGSCSAVKDDHPDLPTHRYHELIAQFAKQPLSEKSKALETLLFHHARAQTLLADHGAPGLDEKRRALLARELKRTHAWLEARLIDEHGVVRVHLKPTRVPLGIKQHLWPKDVVAIQPTEVSGTVKRVGLYHLWTRL